MTDCIFCKIASGQIPATIVARTTDAVAFRDLNPQAPTHVLVIPMAHVSSLSEATSAEAQAAVAQAVTLATRVATELGLDEPGYRLVINNGKDGGQSVWHVHVHLLGGRRLGWPPG